MRNMQISDCVNLELKVYPGGKTQLINSGLYEISEIQLPVWNGITSLSEAGFTNLKYSG